VVEFESKESQHSNIRTSLQGENVVPNKRKKLKEASNFFLANQTKIV
jgi:Holliday junction resolvase-like predicted endonuclease